MGAADTSKPACTTQAVLVLAIHCRDTFPETKDPELAVVREPASSDPINAVLGGQKVRVQPR